MKKYFIAPLIALLLIGLVFSSGCIKKSEEKEAPKKMFVGGDKGLELSFMSNMPPDEVYGGQKFTIGVKIENKGEYTVNKDKATVTIGGISTKSYGIETPQVKNKNKLTGKKLVGGETVPGAFEVLEFSATAPNLPGDTEVPIAASVCYPYQSEGVATVCIKENLYAQTTDAPYSCKVTEEKTVYNRGAPVKVTYVKEVPMGEKTVGFQIKIKNKGGGKVYAAEAAGCKGMENSNKVDITAKLLNTDLTLDCNPTPVILANGEATVLCKGDLSDVTGEYEDLLQITLDYKYSKRVQKKVKIIHVEETKGL